MSSWLIHLSFLLKIHYKKKIIFKYLISFCVFKKILLHSLTPVIQVDEDLVIIEQKPTRFHIMLIISNFFFFFSPVSNNCLSISFLLNDLSKILLYEVYFFVISYFSRESEGATKSIHHKKRALDFFFFTFICSLNRLFQSAYWTWLMDGISLTNAALF